MLFVIDYYQKEHIGEKIEIILVTDFLTNVDSKSQKVQNIVPVENRGTKHCFRVSQRPN